MNDSTALTPRHTSRTLDTASEAPLTVGTSGLYNVINMSAISNGPCAVCDLISDDVCGGCNSVFYCSSDHQRQHWKTHKKSCKSSSCAPASDVCAVAASAPLLEPPASDVTLSSPSPAADSLEERARHVFANIAKMKAANAVLDQRIDQTVNRAVGAKSDMQSYELAFKVSVPCD
jgi:hypothetical protein